MKNLDFEWLTDEFMLYCRSTQLREKTMSSYEQTLHLFGRWLSDELKIYTVDKITENVIRKYIDDLMVRGKYTFYVNDLSKKKNCPDRRRDYRKPVTISCRRVAATSSMGRDSVPAPILISWVPPSVETQVSSRREK